MQLQTYKSPDSPRMCGECTACCTAIAVAALEKPINVRCSHVLDRKGCAIYPHRPAGCESFQCAWLRGLLPEEFRPDQGGIVWYFENYRMNGAIVLQAYLLHPRIAIEQVEFQLAKIQQSIADRIVCQVVPAGLSCKVYGAFHLRRIRPSIYLADREATSQDMAQCPVVGKPQGDGKAAASDAPGGA